MRDKDLIHRYRLLDADIANYESWMHGSAEDEAEPFLPTLAARPEAEGKLAELKARLTALPEPDPVFALVKAHMQDYMQATQAGLAARYTQPGRSIGGAMWMYESLYSQDSRAQDVRARTATEMLEKAPALFAAMDEWLGTVSPFRLMEALGAARNNVAVFTRYASQVAEHFPGLDETAAKALAAGLEGFAACNAQLIPKLEALLKDAEMPAETTDDSILKMDADEYAAVLMNEHGVELSELLDWHEAEIEKTRAAALAIANKLDIPEKPVTTMGQVNAILLKYAGPADTAEEMLARGRAYIQRTAAAAKDFVWMPEETCNVVTVPEIIKISYPWGGYGGGCHRRRPLIGEMFLNNYNFKAVTDGWIKMNTVHEAYPGHHVQFVRTTVDPIPETLKRGAKHTPITEGTPHRSEELFEFVFPEDPFYPLFVAYRRHHTAVRIKADLMLRYSGNPIKEVVQLYMDEMDFDRGTARGQVAAQETMLGYFTTYYYGYKMLSQWEREYTFDKKQYTELLFSAGRMSLQNFKRFLDLTDEQRHSFTHDFASLIQFNEDYTEKPIKMD